MARIKINDLARELGLQPRRILDVLPTVGVETRKPLFASLHSTTADKIREILRPHDNQHRKIVDRVTHRPLIERTSIKPAHAVDGRQSLGRLSSVSALSEARSKKKHRKLKICPMCRCSIKAKKLQSHIKAVHESRTPCPICSAQVHIRDLDLHREWHIRKSAENALNGVPPSRSLEVPDTRTPCELCGAKVFPHAMDRHLAESCQAKIQLELSKLPNLAGMRFPFVTLPPGQWDYRQVFDHYLRLKAHRSFDQPIDWDRITQLMKLNPALRHFGVKEWFGYAVYEFSYTRKVVLECPIIGNATYVITGDWTKLIRKTKFVLRSEYTSQCRWIVHQGDWLTHVASALREKTYRRER